MSKNVIIGLVAAVLIAGGAWHFYSKNGGASMMMQGSAEEAPALGSIKELMARGSSECTVSNKVENSESSGTVYVGNGKMRGDFKSVTQNPAMTIESHMISDGEFIYTWSDAMPQGVKIAVSNAETAGAKQSGQQDMYNAQVNYDCDSWRVDEKKFELPSGVEFMDLGAMMQGMNAGASANAPTNGAMNPPSKSQQCAMCDGAPEPQRSQCRQALQCR